MSHGVHRYLLCHSVCSEGLRCGFAPDIIYSRSPIEVGCCESLTTRVLIGVITALAGHPFLWSALCGCLTGNALFASWLCVCIAVLCLVRQSVPPPCCHCSLAVVSAVGRCLQLSSCTRCDEPWRRSQSLAEQVINPCPRRVASLWVGHELHC